MPEEIKIEVTGLKELGQRLDGVARAADHWPFLRKAQRAAMKPIYDHARAKYASIADTGNLAKSIKYFTSKKYKSVRIGFKWPRNINQRAIDRFLKTGTRPAYYSVFLESGFQHKGGASVPARNILTGAFDTHEPSMLRRYKDTLGNEIEKAWKKNG